MEQTHIQNKAPTVGTALISVPETPLEFATPLREVKVVVMGQHRELGLLDEGSEIVIIRGDLCKELGLVVNRKRKIMMQTANGGKKVMLGCVEYLELEVGGVKMYVHAFMVQSALYRLFVMIRLGQAFWHQGTPAVMD